MRVASVLAMLTLLFGAEPIPVFPDPPRLATTAAELAATRARADFPQLRDQALAAADPLLATPVTLPAGHGSWIFSCTCPDDGSTLPMVTPSEHRCPTCAKAFGDERTNAAYRSQLHAAAEGATVTLGWAYAYSGDERYAVEARRILVSFAAAYPGYPQRQDRWGRKGWMAPLGGRRYMQSLDEAVGIITLAHGYDLCRTATCWSGEDRVLVERELFGLTAQTLLPFNHGINNHQTWYNAGLMAIASMRDDAALVERVLTMPGGFRDQLARSIGSDGPWYEGSMSYHSYALQAMIALIDAGRRLGLPLERETKVRAFIAAPLDACYPDGSFPAITDGDPGHFRMFTFAFSWAWSVYREPRFAHAAAWGDPAKLAALLGPDAKPQWPVSRRSTCTPPTAP